MTLKQEIKNMGYIISENNKQLNCKKMTSVNDVIEQEARNIEYVAGLWYCYLIHQFFNDSSNEFYAFVNRVKNDSKLSNDDIKLVQLCLSESLLKEISNERFAFSECQIKADKKLKQRFDEDGIPIKSGRINVYTRIKDCISTHFKNCKEKYDENCQADYIIESTEMFPYALEAVKQRTVLSTTLQNVKIPTLYFPFEYTFKRLYYIILGSYNIVLDEECYKKLHRLFDTFNLNFDDASYSKNMDDFHFERKRQAAFDKLNEKQFKKAVYCEDFDYDELLEDAFKPYEEDIERPHKEKSDFLKKLEKLGDSIINSKADTDEQLFEKHKTTYSNQDEEYYWYIYDQFHGVYGNYHRYGK